MRLMGLEELAPKPFIGGLHINQDETRLFDSVGVYPLERHHHGWRPDDFVDGDTVLTRADSRSFMTTLHGALIREPAQLALSGVVSMITTARCSTELAGRVYNYANTSMNDVELANAIVHGALYVLRTPGIIYRLKGLRGLMSCSD